MNKEYILIATITLMLSFCSSKEGNRANVRSPEAGVLFLKTEFYDSSGNSVFLSPMKIWYLDSLVIEEVVRIETGTDTANRTSVTYPVEVYKYFDLVNKNWFDYKTFTDTSRIVRSGILPDSLVRGTEWRGWAFYTNSIPMKNEPEVLPDTTIGGTKYMRIKFSKLNGEAGFYVIGFLRYDNKGKIFSLEKIFSNKVNCTMTQFFEFKDGASRPFASRKLEFLSDTLSRKELQVFRAWEKNQLKVLE